MISTSRPWHDDINDIVDDKYDIILGFNEPNHADQSDIPPEEAAAAWIELQTMYPDKVRVNDYYVRNLSMILDSCESCSSWWKSELV